MSPTIAVTGALPALAAMLYVNRMDAKRPEPPATLWGEGLSADEVAASAGTVSYELLCALSPRVPVSETL